VNDLSTYSWFTIGGTEPLARPQCLPGATEIRIQINLDEGSVAPEPAALSLLCPDVLTVQLPAVSLSYEALFTAQHLTVPLIRHLREAQSPAVYLSGLMAATIDLPRILKLLQIPCVLHLDQPPQGLLGNLSASARAWVCSGIQACTALTARSNAIYKEWKSYLDLTPPLIEHVSWVKREDEIHKAQSLTVSRYMQYELTQRHHPLLAAMAKPDVAHFVGCSSVLDLGCGVGIFLWLLAREGIQAVGVERDPWLAQYARELALDVHEADALTFLDALEAAFDGVYCSHFIEHLPVEAAQSLLMGIAKALRPGGVAVLVFPDPESIRSQLLGFWRDPEHVRFYHPELVTTMAASVGLVCEWTSYENQPHQVVSFSEHPEPLPVAESMASPMDLSWLAKFKQKLGLADSGRTEALITENRALRAQIEALDRRTQKLWQVNQTWAWQDNAVLRLRKPA
jgi:SAM-dependent methyltransferase